MSRVIKNNDGVAVVEGTPAASLIKDVDKIFATKPPERMAGEIATPVNIKDLTDQALVSRPAPGSTIPLGPDDRPLEPTPKPSIFEPLERATIKGRGGFETEPGYAIGPADNIIPYPNDPRLEGRQIDYTKSTNRFIREKAFQQEQLPFAKKDDPDYAEKKKEYFTNMTEESSPETEESSPELAVKKAKSFKRQRSSLEAERSEKEQEATQGKFITTLGR